MTHSLSRHNLESWLDHLIGHDEGVIKLINLFLSFKHKLVGKNILRSFLKDCTSLGATTVDEALAHFDQVCSRDETYYALCDVQPISIKATSTLSTVMRSLTFHQFILRRPITKVKSILPLEPKFGDNASESVYRDALAREIARLGWYNPIGTLGKPFPDPRNVWLTEWAFLDKEIKADPSGDTEATKVRDALGMIDTRERTYLLSIHFSAGDLHRLTRLRMARPGFADQGNKRFAVYLGKAAESAYRHYWGMTTHLEKLRARPRQAINGVPERVCAPIPLQAIANSAKIIPLGWVVNSRGDQLGVDDDAAFIGRLRGRRTVASIKREIIKLTMR